MTALNVASAALAGVAIALATWSIVVTRRAGRHRR